MRRFLLILVVLAIAGGAAFYLLTMPRPLDAAVIPERPGDAAHGEWVFWAGGCAGCHAAPGAEGDARLVLAGGVALRTEFGTFYAPNISPDREHGIGTWSALDLVNAMKRGLAPDGSHLYPAFPYTSYQRMTIDDIVDLAAFLKTLPPSAEPSRPHELSFPYSFRRGIGLWKLAYFDGETFTPAPSKSAEINHGAYIVEGPGHCNECHTPRDRFGGLDRTRAFAGAPNPDGEGTIPNITSGEGGISDWTAEDIAAALETGFKPDFDSFGGSMVEVQENMAHLTPEDRLAIGMYLKEVPAQNSAR